LLYCISAYLVPSTGALVMLQSFAASERFSMT
jgi:hypothetical protein